MTVTVPPVVSRQQVLHELTVLVTQRAEHRTELLQRLIALDSIADRIDVLLGRLRDSR